MSHLWFSDKSHRDYVAAVVMIQIYSLSKDGGQREMWPWHGGQGTPEPTAEHQNTIRGCDEQREAECWKGKETFGVDDDVD